MKKSILNLGKALNQEQLKQISGGEHDPYDAWGNDCENHNHIYDYNHERWLCLGPGPE
ncbi:Ribosomally synthesized peptide [Tenacibaculum mesophilum]|uniref:Grasp-with-spasm system A modified peptide n=1 Tax=Tenacibaculum mesophilum TaxID=104268 RepID=A0AAE9MKM2_9FLAO|nr:grasp-with-spasm system A modified peptide [Tenacibaculum mesophilum]GFE00133.1 hypothetical protein KUL156_27250 [Alteromonas sp. KUL156]AZJ31928.1 grasp-with-spasm system A modified peptide [Tenacibaculum mesophilum]QFS27185.1 grasp-with-spasm system A modified peptide [Tenacibaculum mesophilum]UTD14606.1 grasp-with-spasm system A modified peptide [Tenacibaculum mesophilum]SHF86631.1 Ribosomally synthesized peptide [Tenacibaculum mesophilum]